ncbi:MAG: hypothetical protein R3C18_15895 [Planctomycetaceae bacterium]
MLPESTSSPQRPPSPTPVDQPPSPPQDDWWNGSPDQQLAYVFGLAISGLIVVAFIANGAGAGSQHHHVVQYILAGLFITGAGVLGLLGMNAACGCCGIDADATLDDPQAEQSGVPRQRQRPASVPVQPAPSVTIPHPAHSTPFPAAPAVPSRPAPSSPLASGHDSETNADQHSGEQKPHFPQSDDFLSRRRRRARRA